MTKLVFIISIAFLLAACGTQQPEEADKTGGKTAAAFLSAAEEGSLEKVKELLARGVDVNARDEDGHTAVHLAVVKASSGIEYDCKLIELLIDAGVDINAKDNGGRTPLYYALEGSLLCNGPWDLLLDKGCDPNIADTEGRTPLHLACANEYIDIVKILIDFGADFKALDYRNRTPLCFLPGAKKHEIRTYILSQLSDGLEQAMQIHMNYESGIVGIISKYVI